MKKLSRSFKVLLFFILLLLVWLGIAPLLAYLLIVEKSLEKADVIWLLSGSSTYIERNQEAALAYKKGIAAKIILTNDGEKSGWSKTEQRNTPYVELAKRELIQQGVPSEAIEILPGITKGGTRIEADSFANEVQKQNLKSVLLITSAYHSRRALWTFQKASEKNNLSIEFGVQSPPTGQQTPPPFTWWMSKKGWIMVGGEYLKMIYYWMYY